MQELGRAVVSIEEKDSEGCLVLSQSPANIEASEHLLDQNDHLGKCLFSFLFQREELRERRRGE
jgi:hypothetical protein